MLEFQDVSFSYLSEAEDLVSTAKDLKEGALLKDGGDALEDLGEAQGQNRGQKPGQAQGEVQAQVQSQGDAQAKLQVQGEVAPQKNHIVNSLTHINLAVKKGEFILITGSSGCGKSTLIRLVNGLSPKYYSGKLLGKVTVAGEDNASKELYEISRIVGTVFQNPRSQFFNVDSTSEMAFACENQAIKREEILERISDTVEKFHLEHLMHRNLFKLSGGEKQKIACAAMDVLKPKVILLDEPSANLDYEAAQDLRSLIERWLLEGKTIIVSEHRLSYLWGLPDRMLIMDKGEIVREFSKKELQDLTPEKLASLDLRSCENEDPTKIDLPNITPEDKVITLKNFSFCYKKGFFNKGANNKNFNYDDVKIALGKITAITGFNGVGKSTFLNCLCGLEKHCKGLLEYEGPVLNRKERLKKFFMVMQDVNHELFTESVWEELMLSFKDKEISEEVKEKTALEVLRELNLLEFKDRHPMSLSGGQKQRVAVACALCSDREFLLFDEPTSGLDYGSMKRVSSLLKSLRDKGKTIILVTHDSELIRSCCDRLLVLKGRK